MKRTEEVEAVNLGNSHIVCGCPTSDAPFLQRQRLYNWPLSLLTSDTLALKTMKSKENGVSINMCDLLLCFLILALSTLSYHWESAGGLIRKGNRRMEISGGVAFRVT